MSTAPSANVRVLELFVELLGARPGRTKAQLRSLPGYRGLADEAFETQFQRDKDALRDAGVHLSVGRSERYAIDRDSFAPDIEVTSVDRVLLSMSWLIRSTPRRRLRPRRISLRRSFAWGSLAWRLRRRLRVRSASAASSALSIRGRGS